MTTSVLDYKRAFDDALIDIVARGMIFARPRLLPQDALGLAKEYVASLEVRKHVTIFVPLNVPEGPALAYDSGVTGRTMPLGKSDGKRGKGTGRRRAEPRAEKEGQRKRRPRWLGDRIL